MDLLTKSVKGTEDILPDKSYKRQFVEDLIRKQSEFFGFKQIRTPVFEHTELFLRSVGETTDVVQKEMYTFHDKGGRSITLRPEGTAGAIRSILEHGVYNNGLPVKVSYIGPCYRYEKPQTGRLREFFQFGVEVIGSETPLCDAEVIIFASSVIERLGLENISLEINSIGCPECRKEYYNDLRKYFSSIEDKLCNVCKSRLERNPMRILDCKSETCSAFSKDAPSIVDYLCKDCKSHFELVKEVLTFEGIEFKVNPKIVRGLDYYTRTVFEFVSDNIGAKGTICAGGRYDGLIKELSGIDMPAIGLSFGIDRVMLLVEKLGLDIPENPCDLYIVAVGNKAHMEALKLVNMIRNASMNAQCDLMDRSVRAQMKCADKIKARFSLTIGDDELKSCTATLRNMVNAKTTKITIGHDFVEDFIKISLKEFGENLKGV